MVRLAVENEVNRQRQRSQRERLKLPLLGSKEPGTLDLSNADIEELLA